MCLGALFGLVLGAAEAPAAERFGAHAIQPAPFTSLDKVSIPSGNTLLYHYSKAYDLDPATGLTGAARPDLWAPIPSEAQDGSRWSLKAFGMPPVTMDRVLAFYQYAPPGSSTFTGNPLFDQARDEGSGQVAPPGALFEFWGNPPTGMANSAGISADGGTLALVGAPRPLSSESEYILRAAFRNESGSFDIAFRDQAAGNSVRTQPNRVAVFGSGDMIAVLVPVNAGLGSAQFSELVIYRRDGSILRHIQTLSTSPDARDLLVDYQDRNTLIVPDQFAGALNVFQWFPEAGVMTHAATVPEPLLVSTGGHDMTIDGRLICSATNNRVRLWGWDRSTFTLTLLDEAAFTEVPGSLLDLRFSQDGKFLLGIARASSSQAHSLVAFRIESDAARSDVVDALLSGTENPGAMDANVDGVLDAADAVRANP